MSEKGNSLTVEFINNKGETKVENVEWISTHQALVGDLAVDKNKIVAGHLTIDGETTRIEPKDFRDIIVNFKSVKKGVLCSTNLSNLIRTSPATNKKGDPLVELVNFEVEEISV